MFHCYRCMCTDCFYRRITVLTANSQNAQSYTIFQNFSSVFVRVVLTMKRTGLIPRPAAQIGPPGYAKKTFFSKFFTALNIFVYCMLIRRAGECTKIRTLRPQNLDFLGGSPDSSPVGPYPSHSASVHTGVLIPARPSLLHFLLTANAFYTSHKILTGEKTAYGLNERGQIA